MSNKILSSNMHRFSYYIGRDYEDDDNPAKIGITVDWKFRLFLSLDIYLWAYVIHLSFFTGKFNGESEGTSC